MNKEMTQKQFNAQFEGICQAVLFGSIFLFAIGYEVVQYFS